MSKKIELSHETIPVLTVDTVAGIVGGAGKKFQGPPVVPGEDAFDAFPAPDFPLAVDQPRRAVTRRTR
jgi:hypothetical protein